MVNRNLTEEEKTFFLEKSIQVLTGLEKFCAANINSIEEIITGDDVNDSTKLFGAGSIYAFNMILNLVVLGKQLKEVSEEEKTKLIEEAKKRVFPHIKQKENDN